jgi:DNA-binding beta-propeller fold protein YncE
MKPPYRIIALTALLICGLAPAVASTGTAAAGVRPSTTGSRLWVARYQQPSPDPADEASAMAVSPDGSTVFVTGQGATFSQGKSIHWLTVAYDAATGHMLWAARFQDAPKGINYAFALAVSPNGSTVFVTGRGAPAAGGTEYVTVAYDASTGATLWSAHYAGKGGYNGASSIAVSPDGSSVFVTGTTSLTSGTSVISTLGYDATTGAVLWTAQYGNPAQGSAADSVRLAPDGATVYVTGASGNDFVTLAYDAATGATAWTSRYAGEQGGGTAAALAVSPDGSKVLVTGSNGTGNPPDEDYVTIAYNAVTGARLWLRRYQGPGGGEDMPTGIAVSPDNSAVFVTGQLHGPSTGYSYATVAYSTTTGTKLWSVVDPKPGLGATGLAVNPDGSTVYVTGTNYVSSTTGDSDFATVAYSTVTGALEWRRDYGGPDDLSEASAVAVSPDGSKVFVTGFGQTPTSQPNFATAFETVAYSG